MQYNIATVGSFHLFVKQTLVNLMNLTDNDDDTTVSSNLELSTKSQKTF